MTASLALLAFALAPQTSVSASHDAPALADEAIRQDLSSRLKLSKDRTEVEFVEQRGALWARGKSYKASADERGFTFIPFLGSKASRNWPVGFEVQAATLDSGAELELTAPKVSRHGNTLVIDRGAVTARYVMGLDEVEQTFVLEGLAGSTSDFVLDLDVTTDLAVTRKGDGWGLAGPDGEVNFGAATVLDAAGRSLAIEARLTPDHLQFTVPAAFLAVAEGPVVIDPVISTHTLDDYFLELTNPDVAFEASSETYLVAYEEAFSATDGDVYTRTFDSQTLIINEEEYADVSSLKTWRPKVASHAAADTYLVVCMQADTFDRITLQGRIQDADLTGGWGPEFYVAGFDEFHRRLNHDVGGTAFEGSLTRNYIIVWERAAQGGGNFPSGVEARLIGGNGAYNTGFIQVTPFSDTRSASNIQVSKSDGDPDVHASWWISWASGASLGQQTSVRGARVNFFGTVTQADTEFFAIPGTTSITEIDVSSAYQAEWRETVHVTARLSGSFGFRCYDYMRGQQLGGSIEDSVQMADLVDLSYSGLRRAGVFATLGARCMKLYWDRPAQDPFVGQQVFATSMEMARGNRFAVGERRVAATPLAGASSGVGGAASEASGGRLTSGRMLYAWHDEELTGSGTDNNIYGVVINANTPQAVGGVVTCGGTRNSTEDFGFLAAFGDNSTTGNKVLRASSLPQNSLGFFLASTSRGATTPPGSNGRLCLAGSIGRYSSTILDSGNGGRFELAINPAAISQPTGAVSANAGQTWYFQAWHRDVGMTASSNFTNAVGITF